MVGVGNWVNMYELQNIASSPYTLNTVVLSQGFSSLYAQANGEGTNAGTQLLGLLCTSEGPSLILVWP